MNITHFLVFKGQNTREIAKINDLHDDGTPKLDHEIMSEAQKLIRAFCDERNFKIHYTRVWNSDGKTVFDVGSHTEFFHLIPEVDFSTGGVKMEHSTNKLNLVPAIREVEAQIHELETKFNAEVKPYRDSLKALRKINRACERCNGEGKVLRSRACAEDDRPDPDDPSDYITCPICHGTGLSKKEKEEDK